MKARASRAKPRLEEGGCERGRRPTLRGLLTRRRPNEGAAGRDS
jgi:hypothetical protein